eukprot:gene9348-11076_t
MSCFEGTPAPAESAQGRDRLDDVAAILSPEAADPGLTILVPMKGHSCLRALPMRLRPSSAFRKFAFENVFLKGRKTEADAGYHRFRGASTSKEGGMPGHGQMAALPNWAPLPEHESSSAIDKNGEELPDA